MRHAGAADHCAATGHPVADATICPVEAVVHFAYTRLCDLIAKKVAEVVVTVSMESPARFVAIPSVVEEVRTASITLRVRAAKTSLVVAEDHIVFTEF